MSSTANFYPPSPLSIPKNFTKLPISYKVKAALAILAVIVFFLLYLGLIAATLWLFYQAVIIDVSISLYPILLKLGAIAGAGMLFAFTLKFLFKLRNVQPENRIKVELIKNPKLKEFVLQICKETGAPKPKYVYIDPDVNAYVSYSNLWLSLIFPTRKNLTIGFGLVACLNMTEFKAVIAHEFGHFAQNSMKIGSYIISANTIIHDMIYTRDSWDQALDKWRSTDLRLAAAAWIITPLIWLIRQLLGLFYQLLSFVYSSLSREMEFNADKVAISTTGSEPIISSLWKLDHGSACWNVTVQNAYLASQKDLYVDNIYTHNDIALAKAKQVMVKSIDQMPKDSRGGKLFFESSKHSVVSMYASHPPNDHRETNAKTPFIKCDIDDRSAWILFEQKEELQQALTSLIYKNYFNKTPSQELSVNDFQYFIKAESAGSELLEEYCNTFRDRFVNPPDRTELITLSSKIEDAEMVIQQLKTRLQDLMKPVDELEKNLISIQEIASGTSKHKTFTYRDKTYKKRQMQELFDKVFTDREDLMSSTFTDWDREFFAVYYKIARSNKNEDELLAYYAQHNKISKFYKRLITSKNDIYKKLYALQNDSEATQFQVDELSDEVAICFEGLNKGLLSFDDEGFIPLPNIDTVNDLKNAIIDGGNFENGGRSMFKTGKFDRMMQNLDIAINHLQRLDQRSIATILTFHHDLLEKDSKPRTA
ncbi:hypothetical protein AAU57_00055 [Nonlabens sp. YIK11]|uniref:M48 family metallopeptidase n=1 Tax=Nonlabens sp. YIK11 TaxID=1453349 RepID=UPI0006DCE310|nr:M48 family metallopeptidase [Nonlabens sp. YIK11]KQC31891.1 hypothetical protein AAU57_00055 [Nonlabens sp. YIK11]